MMENDTFLFHRPTPNRWNVDVPSVYGNTWGGSSCVSSQGVPTSADQWHNCYLKIEALLCLLLQQQDQLILLMSWLCILNREDHRESQQG